MKREVGEKPARSRHCKCEFFIHKPLFYYGKAMESDEHKPGDLPILAPIYKPTRIGGVADSSYVLWIDP